tara:strand:- start:6985 stop:8709 length:1725 start_codon:yes stop_codon:yes gene_type:complete
MSFLLKYLTDLKFLLSFEQKKEFNLFFFLFFLAMILETLGIGIIIPVLKVLVEENFQDSNFFSIFIKNLNFSKDELIYLFLLLTFLIYSLKSLFLAYVARKEVNFIKKIRISLSEKLFSTYLNLPYKFHLDTNSGNLIRNITDIKLYLNLLLHTLIVLVESFVFVGIVVFLIIYEPIGAMTSLFLLGSFGLLFYMKLQKKSEIWGKERQIFEGLKIINTQQGLNAIKDIKILGREKYFIDLFTDSDSQAAESQKKHDFILRLPRIVLELIAVLTVLTLVLVLLQKEKNFASLIPTLGLFAVSAFRIMPSMAKILRSIQIINFARPVLQLLKEEIYKGNQITQSPSVVNNLQIVKKIDLKNISFSYPNTAKSIFKNLNFTIQVGDSVGIFGKSGTGKTTLINILLGLIEPQNGDIQVDDKSILGDIKSWQRKIGYVPQNIYLTDDSLKSNIAFGVEEKLIDLNLVNQLIKQVKLEEFVGSLKSGVNSKAGEYGEKLSGGQRQRIGIARCLYNNPEVIIFDEATNALDKKTAEEIIDEINSFKRKKTAIIVSHDLYTLKNCDKIYDLNDGNFKIHK